MGILGDLVPLGKIGVKIVLPLKDADGIDGTSRRQPGPDPQANRLGIEDGKGSRMGQAHRADEGIGRSPETVLTAAEHLGFRQKLGMDLKAHDNFIPAKKRGSLAHFSPPPFRPGAVPCVA
jgi:hypothetical protein